MDPNTSRPYESFPLSMRRKHEAKNQRRDRLTAAMLTVFKQDGKDAVRNIVANVLKDDVPHLS